MTSREGAAPGSNPPEIGSRGPTALICNPPEVESKGGTAPTVKGGTAPGGNPPEVRPTRSQAEVDAAMELRRVVFCEEQGVPLEAERDGRDHEAVHLVALDGERVVGTCRLLTDQGAARLGRMAVAADRRGAGVGGALLREADRAAVAAGTRLIHLHAQARARRVYDRAGYEVRGEPFIEEGIEHVAMEKQVA